MTNPEAPGSQTFTKCVLPVSRYGVNLANSGQRSTEDPSTIFQVMSGTVLERVGMRTRINDKWLVNCTSKELQQMNRLRFKGDSMMYQDIICQKAHRDRIRIFFLKEGSHIVGWSATILPITKKEFMDYPCYPTSYGTTYAPVYTYVKAALRGSGYGKRLLLSGARFAISKQRVPVTFYHDATSQKFFELVCARHPELKTHHIDNWWKLFPPWTWYANKSKYTYPSSTR